MSSRPQREVKPIRTLANNQGRAAAEDAARRKDRPRTKKIKPVVKKNIQPQNKRILSPKNAQSRVYAILDSLSQGKNDKIYNMLYSIYRDATSTLFTRLELDDNALIASIEEQYKVVSDNIRQAGGATNTLSLNFKTPDDKINFCLLMWLDMSHDSTVGTNFETFVNSSIVNTFLSETISYKKDTEMMSRMKELGIITTEKTKKGVGKLKGLWPGSQFENRIKVNLPYIFGVQEPITTIAVSTKLSNSAKNRDNKPIYVTIDSESEFKSISTLIENAKYPFTTSNGKKITRYYLKPIITLSNRVDPGRLMPIKGITEEFSKLMQKADKLKSTQLYNVKDCNFKVGKTRLTLGTAGRGKFNLKINDNEVPYGITAGEARKASNDNDKLSKFLGDFMQILTVLSKPVNQRIVLGTLDGVLCGMYCFLSKSLMNEEPRIFIDMSFKQRNQIVMYGVSDLLQVGKNVKPQVSTVGSNFISSNNNSTEVSRGNHRTEGSGNSNGIFGRSPRTSRNKPKTPNRKKGGNVRMGNANNTQSVAGSSQGSVSRNNNNNNNNVSQNPKNNANANAKLAAMFNRMQSTPPKPNNASKSNKNLAQALANSKRLTNKWQSLKKNVLARRNKIRNNFRAVVSAAVKQNKNKKEVEKKARENAENEMSRLRAELEEAKKAALSAQKEVENQRRKNIKRKREENRLNINNSRRTRSRP